MQLDPQASDCVLTFYVAAILLLLLLLLLLLALAIQTFHLKSITIF